MGKIAQRRAAALVALFALACSSTATHRVSASDEDGGAEAGASSGGSGAREAAAVGSGGAGGTVDGGTGGASSCIPDCPEPYVGADWRLEWHCVRGACSATCWTISKDLRATGGGSCSRCNVAGCLDVCTEAPPAAGDPCPTEGLECASYGMACESGRWAP